MLRHACPEPWDSCRNGPQGHAADLDPAARANVGGPGSQWGAPAPPRARRGGQGRAAPKGLEGGKTPLWLLLPRPSHLPARGVSWNLQPQPLLRMSPLAKASPGSLPGSVPVREGSNLPAQPHTYQPWASPVKTLLRASPPCPQSEGTPRCWIPSLEQRGFSKRLQQAWRCVTAPHGCSGKASPRSQTWMAWGPWVGQWRETWLWGWPQRPQDK